MTALFKLKNTNGSLLWDFIRKDGGGNPGNCGCQVRHLHWASREPQTQIIESESRDGGWLAKSRQGLKQSTHLINLIANSKDSLLTGYNALTEYLKDGKGKYFEYQLSDASDLLYLDFTHGWTDALMREDSGFWVETDNEDHGLPLTIVHQPYFRLDEIDAALNKLTNATLLCDENNDGRPNDWAWVDATNVSAESISNGYSHRTVSTGSTRWLYQAVSGAVAGDIWTGSFDAYTDNATIGRVSAVLEFLTAADAVLVTHSSTIVAPSTDPNNPTRVSMTTTAAPATTAKVRLKLASANTSASAIVHSWRHANLSRTTLDPTFRVGVETVSNDPASTTSGWRARAFPVWIDSDGPVKARLKWEGIGEAWGTPARVGVLPFAHPADSYRWLNRRKYEPMESASLGAGATLVADANASGAGSNAIEITSTDLSIVRATNTISTDLTALRGRFMLMARLRGTVATDDWSIKTEWTMGGSATYSTPIVYVPDIGTSFRDIQIGVVTLPEDTDPASVVLKLYARRDAGTGLLRGDVWMFAPPEQLTTVSHPLAGANLVSSNGVVESDPDTATVKILNSSLQVFDYGKARITPFVLQPGLSVLYFADDGGVPALEIKASLLYSPTRHA